MAKKINAFFKALLKAKNSNASSFTYKGKTYKKTKSKTGLVVYKK